MPTRELDRIVEEFCHDVDHAQLKDFSTATVRLALLQARDDERRRMARDLHDVTAQLLLTLEFDLNRIEGGCQ